ncbi:MAG: hypothetical protein ACRC35_01565 [Angustibacter sp.]
MIGYWINLRASRTRLAAPLCAVFALLYTFSSPWWIGSWGGTVLAATNAFSLALPVFAACASLDAATGRSSRAVPGIRHAARAGWLVVLTPLAALSTWVLATYLLVLLTLGAATLGQGARLAVPWPQLGVGALGVLAFVWVGFALGRFLPRLAAVPLALFVSYGANVALAAATDQPGALFATIDDGSMPAGFALRADVAVGQASWFAGLLLVVWVLVSVATVPGRGVTLRAIPVVIALAAVTAAGWNLSGVHGSRAALAPATGPRACDAGARVCLWSEHAYLVPAVSLIAARMLDERTGWRGGRVDLVELGLVDDRGTAVAVFFDQNRPSPDGLARAVAISTVGARLEAHGCDEPGAGLTPEVLSRQEWLIARALQVRDDTLGPEVDRVLRLPSDRQWAWFTDVRC